MHSSPFNSTQGSFRIFLFLFIAVLITTSSGYTQNIEKGKYYRLQFKTASDQNLRIGNNGVAGGSRTQDDLAKWLFIPTGIQGEYWIFNKAAQNGTGQALTLPQGQSNFGQWKFINVTTQRFNVYSAPGGYVRLVVQSNREAVSTRWNDASFTWAVNANDDAQLFKLVEAGDIKCDDNLPEFLTQNINIAAFKSYFADLCTEPTTIENGKYYRLRFKTAGDQYLRIGGNGVAGGSRTMDQYSEWVFIPTGASSDEYWIFNKGARDGMGQALTLPSGKSNFGQWEFLDEQTQRFTMRKEANGFFRLIVRSNGEAISTRWNDAAFTWAVNLNDNAQLFSLVEAGEVECDDVLSSYLFWNANNSHIEDYFLASCEAKDKLMPGPQILAIKKLVFINNNVSRSIRPAIHRYGCAGAVWRGSLAECWAETIAPGQKEVVEVSHYLQNSRAIWGVIIQSTVVVVSVVATLASAGTGGAFIGGGTSLQAGTLTTAGAIASAAAKNDDSNTVPSVGATTGQVVLSSALPLLGDLAALIWGSKDLGVDIKTVTDGQNMYYPDKVLTHFGVTETLAPKIQNELGKYVFAVKGTNYKELMEDWHIHETTANMGYDRMFFSGGIAVFVVTNPDGPVPDQSYQISPKHSGQCLQTWNASKDDNIPIWQWDCLDRTHFKFVLEDALDGFYYIKSEDSGKYLTVANASKADGAPVQQKSREDQLHFKFALEDAGDGYYYIKAAHSNQYLRIKDGNTALRAPLVQSPGTTLTDDYKFKFISQ